MKVSLCGPHSSDTSTLAPAATEVVEPVSGSGPVLAMSWYLSHQVGLSGPLVCADSDQANPRTRHASGRTFFVMRPPKKIDAGRDSMSSPSPPAGGFGGRPPLLSRRPRPKVASREA